jgi:hypothetical protein
MKKRKARRRTTRMSLNPFPAPATPPPGGAMKRDVNAQDLLGETTVAGRMAMTRASKRLIRRSAHRDGRPRLADAPRTA